MARKQEHGPVIPPGGRWIAAVALVALVAGGCDRFADGSDTTAPVTADDEAASGAGEAPDVSVTATAPSGPLPAREVAVVATAFEPEVIGSVYASDFEDMILDRWDAEGAAGRYALGQGYFEGERDGQDGIDRIEGYWRQAHGEVRCETARDGTHHWGRLQFNFTRDRQSFIGFWGYCDATALDRWNGHFARRDAETVDQIAALRSGAATARPAAPPSVRRDHYAAAGEDRSARLPAGALQGNWRIVRTGDRADAAVMRVQIIHDRAQLEGSYVLFQPFCSIEQPLPVTGDDECEFIDQGGDVASGRTQGGWAEIILRPGADGLDHRLRFPVHPAAGPLNGRYHAPGDRTGIPVTLERAPE